MRTMHRNMKIIWVRSHCSPAAIWDAFVASRVACIKETNNVRDLEQSHFGQFHFARGKIGEVESAAVVAGTTMASMVGHFMAFFNPSKTMRRFLYLNTQSIPCSKQFSSWL
jgi:ABC-type thiamine transport system substrate-binding protein